MSFVALIILLPFFIVIIILLSLTAEKEVFYLQERIGFKNRKFKIWKFATMVKNSPNIGSGDITLKNDPRVTPVGRWLRKTKLNELPQLINIFKGDMSIVGPRPLVQNGFDDYPEAIRYKVYNVKPGLTGVGSILFRDEEAYTSKAIGDPRDYYKNFLQPYKAQLEIWYQENISFFTDIKVIFLTAWVIIFPKSDLPFKWFKNLPEKIF